MAYASWSVVFGEQPSAAKWNILGTNDASFADGTGIANLDIGSGHTSLKVDHKFSIYRNSALVASVSAWTLLTYDTTTFDTGSNVSLGTGRFTAPVAGFYFFNTYVNIASNSTTVLGVSFYKNGAQIAQPYNLNFTSANATTSMPGGTLLQLAANDYVQVYYYSNGAGALTTGAIFNSFQGFLVSQT